jgi:hypothetical protein
MGHSWDRFMFNEVDRHMRAIALEAVAEHAQEPSTGA